MDYNPNCICNYCQAARYIRPVETPQDILEANLRAQVNISGMSTPTQHIPPNINH